MKKILLSITISCLGMSISHAQWTADSTQNTNVRDTLGATTPLVSSAPNGSTYISWFEFTAGNYELHMQLLDSNGYKTWSPEGIVVSNLPQNSALYRYD